MNWKARKMLQLTFTLSLICLLLGQAAADATPAPQEEELRQLEAATFAASGLLTGDPAPIDANLARLAELAADSSLGAKAKLLHENCSGSSSAGITCDAQGYKLVRQIQAAGGTSLSSYTTDCARRLLDHCKGTMQIQLERSFANWDPMRKDSMQGLGKRLYQVGYFGMSTEILSQVLTGLTVDIAGPSQVRAAVTKKLGAEKAYKQVFDKYVAEPCRRLLAQIDPNAELFEQKGLTFGDKKAPGALQVWASAAHYCRRILGDLEDVVRRSVNYSKDFYKWKVFNLRF